jgi:DMSO/TMAO reductase YedYZ molybdopterin-dependent catalytic subunit
VKSGFSRTIYILFSLLMIAVFVVGFAGCKNASNAIATPTSATTSPSSQPVLTIVNGTQTSTYTMEAIKKLPQITGWAGQMSSTGTITGPFEYKGVALTELLKAVGGITDTNAIRASAKDGYAMTLSYNQVTQGSGFPVLDSSTGKEVTPANKPVVFIAYEEAGKPLDDSVGPLRLGIMTANNQVTDGHWWVKWTQKIEVISSVKPWTLKLEGAITENMDQATFESGAAIGCHGLKWTDDQNRAWEGIPLWYLVGRVDDPTETHKGDAFSDALADKGYEVHLVGSDGTMQKLTSAQVKRNDGLIVAYKRDGSPLPENQWPLRLVGAGLTKDQMVGKLATIKIIFPAAATTAAATSSAPAGATVLTLTKGTQSKTYSLDELKALTATSGYGGTKNKAGVVVGAVPLKGVALTDLMSAVGGLGAKDSLKFTAKDGYTKTLTADQINAGTFTTYNSSGNATNAEIKPVVILAYESDGKALDSATGPLELAILTSKNQVTDGSNFVKTIEKIEVTTAQ